MKIGVLAIQGDVSEHIEAVKRALENFDVSGDVLYIRKKEQISRLDYIIIPGGESTTISRLMVNSGIYTEILKHAENGELGVIGTCAGSILMAKDVIDDKRVKTLGLMDMAVRRNFFGRQRESFETELDIEGLGKYHAVFIRAPVIDKCWDGCRPLAYIGDKIAMAKEGSFVALIFHPELTDDYRIYKLFLNL
ncbi:pyridoxal 5'-phosphate synthase glutaminase subunit PdxT [Candidatus Aciduliprofundum boonei]|uniref:Pyridoxal 5'-phosphate synthase subunit PdxT n=1 Tax=Aciduliprofundum boonei (strain DSM 19572 / T469) TaxID=439481 RepID=B5IA83_ACIB4|nr:pyridoxal 5'-phosphate synthase glutaminase subunit PdxT [Candidatus Aciduliprofundum boonei]ADD08279.1 SNO glutamine amidotransferase [Aciduliprofundum boonei T469]EDY36758.1 glutamine amidotransferase, SNO family [Aciduliprofundum boonei T469]HII55022.1 pyridoxal 5'-phosphate synthase glutaminase subunit PdxT [Candidatus Aciduliprofundum boonei]